jgi:LPXTG-motif cell wall-anchored protein
MTRKFVYALLVAIVLSLAVIPAMAQTVCSGIVYFQPSGDIGSDVSPNNGTKANPFQTQAKAFAMLRALNGNCAIELDEVGEPIKTHVRALPPETGVPAASGVLYLLGALGALLLFSAGLWLRRKGIPAPITT